MKKNPEKIIMCLLLILLLESLVFGIIVKNLNDQLTLERFINKNSNKINTELKPLVIIKKELYLPEIEIEEDTNKELLGEFRLTGYCDCEECQEEWVGTTALGVSPTPYHTIAVDPDIIPLGSKVIIDGFDCVFVAEDVGGMIQGNHIDIFVSSHNECFSSIFNRYTNVYLIKD